MIQAATAHPFLKWVGSKRSILPELIARMPDTFGTYCEPFLGGAVVSCFYTTRLHRP